MKIILTANSVVMEDNVVVRLDASIVDKRDGIDSISGSLFITTTAGNMVIGKDETIEIDFTPAVEEPQV